MAEDDLDLVVHLGDYIYEEGVDSTALRQHNSPEIMTLADYRNRHALYKTDPALQATHSAFPWLVTWDDHEVDNNYAGAIPENVGEQDTFLARRAAAYQAYWEHMPLPKRLRPAGANVQLFREVAWVACSGWPCSTPGSTAPTNRVATEFRWPVQLSLTQWPQ
jgi:alkaline phosphatase D